MRRAPFALAAALLAACGGGTNLQAGPFPTPLVRFIYASNAGTNSVLLFSGSTPGNETPSRSITGANTQLNSPAGLALSGGALYVANSGGSVTIYPTFAAGDIPPERFIRGNVTQLSGPSMITVTASGATYVTNAGLRSSIVAFSSSASDNVYPELWIEGSATRLAQPHGIAVDANGDIFVANTADDSVTAYAPVATFTLAANEAPFLRLAGAATGLNAPFGLAIDAFGRMWVGNSGDDTLEVFAPNAFGNAPPLFTIAGGATLLARPQEISFDSAGQLDVANAGAGAASIEVFGPLTFPFPTSGNIAPRLQITGPATQLTSAIGVAAQ